MAGAGVHLAGELAAVAAGRSTVAPAPGDRRFADDAFTRNPLYRRAMQGYLASGAALDGLVDRVGLSGIDAVRARFALTLLTDVLAPTNSLLGNPGALRRAKATRGRSLLRGVRNFAGDVAHNGGLPSMVDTRPFIKGVTVAASPGRVVFRNDVCELIQYAPTTPTVHRRPMVIIPPQVCEQAPKVRERLGKVPRERSRIRRGQRTHIHRALGLYQARSRRRHIRQSMSGHGKARRSRRRHADEHGRGVGGQVHAAAEYDHWLIGGSAGPIDCESLAAIDCHCRGAVGPGQPGGIGDGDRGLE